MNKNNLFNLAQVILTIATLCTIPEFMVVLYRTNLVAKMMLALFMASMLFLAYFFSKKRTQKPARALYFLVGGLLIFFGGGSLLLGNATILSPKGLFALGTMLWGIYLILLGEYRSN